MLGGSRTTAASLAAILLASPALADSKSPSAKDRQAAGELVKKAIARSQVGDHDGAIVIYMQAYTIVPNSVLLSNIGAEYQENDKPAEALQYFCMYLEKDPSGPSAPYATTQAKLLHKQLGHKHIDEDNVCAAPKPEPKPPEDDEDDQPRRRAAPKPPEQPPEPPATSSGSVALKYTGVAAAAVGLTALGISAYYGVQAANTTTEINDKAPCLCNDERAKGQHQENLQIGFLVAGGVLVTTGVILYLLNRSSGSSEPASTKSALRVVPTPSGFAVLGRF